MSFDMEPLAAADLLACVRFGADGLVPVAVQASADRAVLLVGSMNRDALVRTLATKRLWLWSRTRGQLWLKGETSGHFQQVDAIYINCELNSLLVQVTSLGPICHTGHATCFYRQVAGVGQEGTVTRSGEPCTALEAPLRQLYRIYEHLRDADLTAPSATARLLHARDPVRLQARLADELVELAGVADGTHRHAGHPADAILEASQVCYWTYLLSVAAGLRYDHLRPHTHLAVPDPFGAAATEGRNLAATVRRADAPLPTLLLQAVLRYVATACAALEVAPLEVVACDLAQMRQRPYLAALLDAAGEPS